MKSAQEIARAIVELAVKDHDSGGYAFASLNEILTIRIASALEAERAFPSEDDLRQAFFTEVKLSQDINLSFKSFKAGVEFVRAWREKR